MNPSPPQCVVSAFRCQSKSARTSPAAHGAVSAPVLIKIYGSTTGDGSISRCPDYIPCELSTVFPLRREADGTGTLPSGENRRPETSRDPSRTAWKLFPAQIRIRRASEGKRFEEKAFFGTFALLQPVFYIYIQQTLLSSRPRTIKAGESLLELLQAAAAIRRPASPRCVGTPLCCDWTPCGDINDDIETAQRGVFHIP